MQIWREDEKGKVPIENLNNYYEYYDRWGRAIRFFSVRRIKSIKIRGIRLANHQNERALISLLFTKLQLIDIDSFACVCVTVLPV